MSSTPSEGPPSAGPPAVRASGQVAAEPAALLQHQRAAECELADALARFQAEVCPAAEMSLPAVVEAARGAFRLGFAYTSCRGLDEDGQPLLEVTVMHRGGDQLSSQVRLTAEEGEQEFDAAARLLAQLLGIPVLSAAQQAQQSKAEGMARVDSSEAATAVTAVTPVTEAASQQAAAPAATPSSKKVPPDQASEGATPTLPAPAAAPAPVEAAPSATSPPSDAPADPIGPGSPDAPGTEESLRPLEEAERELLLEMIRSLRPVEARRQFQIAFRHHFNVPKEARSIAGFITQQRHKDFVDRFERELADLPPAAAEASSVQTEASA
jgi:hypothetical protein